MHQNLINYWEIYKKPFLIPANDDVEEFPLRDDGEPYGFRIGLMNGSIPYVDTDLIEIVNVVEDDKDSVVAIKLLQNLISQHAWMGVDITNPDYISGIQDTLYFAMIGEL